MPGSTHTDNRRVPDLTPDEARALTDKARSDMVALAETVLVLHDRRAWRAIGYPSWEAYLAQEFGRSRAWGYQQINAARIRQSLSTRVDTRSLNERQARFLAGLPEDLQVRVAKEVSAWGDFKLFTVKHLRLIVQRCGQPCGQAASPPPPSPHASARQPPPPEPSLKDLERVAVRIGAIAWSERLAWDIRRLDSESAHWLGRDLERVIGTLVGFRRQAWGRETGQVPRADADLRAARPEVELQLF